MATDTTNIQNETVNSTVAHEGDVERANLTQGATQVQLPQGENVVRIQVTPGETIQLPFPQDAMVARLDDGNGNLAVKVGDITVILQGYVAATGEADVNLIDVNGQSIDVAAVVAATDPNLDIETAAGPGAGDQGTGPDNNGGVFSPFDPLAGIGGLNGIGGLDPTALEYRLIEREGIVFEEEEAEVVAPSIIEVEIIAGSRIINEDDLPGYRDEEPSLAKAPTSGYSQWGRWGNDAYDGEDVDDQIGDPDGDGSPDWDREPVSSTFEVTVAPGTSDPATMTLTFTAATITALENMQLFADNLPLKYELSPDGKTLYAYIETEQGNYDIFAIHANDVVVDGVNATFEVEFVLLHSLDNDGLQNEGVGSSDPSAIFEDLAIDIPFTVTGSSGSDSSELEVVVRDDTPDMGLLEDSQEGDSQVALLGEGGTHVPGNHEDDDSDGQGPGSSSLCGSFNFSYGADGEATEGDIFQFGALAGTAEGPNATFVLTVFDPEAGDDDTALVDIDTALVPLDGSFDFGASTLKSGDATVYMVGERTVDQTIIEGRADGAEGDLVFTITIDNHTGAYHIEFFKPLNHPDAGHEGSEINCNDVLQFDLTATIRDGDGDTKSATQSFQLEDDGPVANCDFACVDEGCTVVTGNLLANDVLSQDTDHIISEFKHDGVTYTFDGTNVTSSDGSTFQFDGTTLKIETDLGGQLKVDLKGANVGDYEYKSPSSVEHGDPVFKGFEPKADGSNDSLGEWANAFSGLNIEQSGAPGGGFDPGNDLAIKTVTVPGSAGNDPITYRGIGVKHGIDNAETDKSDGALRIGFPADQWSASLTVGALFDGFHFDSGNPESLKWEIWDGNTKVGEGIIYGDRDGLVSLDINEGIKFDRIELIPQDNGAGNNGNNTDFLLVNVTTTKCDDDKTETFEYTLQDKDGDTSSAALKVEVKDLGPDAGHGVTCHSETVVKERAIDDGQDNGPDGGTTPWSDAEVAEGQIQGFDLGPDAQGAAINIQLKDANDDDYNPNGNGNQINDIGDLRSKGQALEYVSDGGIPATITAYRVGDHVKVFSLVIDGDGNYKFELFDQLDHPDKGEGNSQTDANDVINLKFEYTIVDGDACAPGTRDSQNDVAKGTITITVQDDGPDVQCVTATCGTPEFLGYLLLDEDHLQHGNKDQNGKFGDFDGPGGVVATGQIVTNLGADQQASFKFTTQDNSYLKDADGNFVRTSDDGSKIKLDVQQNGTYIVATEDGSNTPVFTLKLNQDGSFEFKLYEAMAHDDTVLTTENLFDILLHFGVRVTDFDGDWVDTVLKFAIDDDQPFFTGASVTKTVEEEALQNYNSKNGSGSNGNQEYPDAEPDVSQTSGSLSSLVSIGADIPGKWEFDGGLNSLYQQDLSSKGVDLNYSINGDTLTAMAGGNIVFTLKVEQDGDFTFKLFDQLDHPADGNTESSLPIDFSKLLKFTDGDGDTIYVDQNGKLVINVVDDKPILTNKEVWAAVEEEKTSGGNDESPDYPNTATASGSLTSLVKVGADENASFSFVSDVVTQMGAKGLTSGGVPLFFTLVGDTLTATKGEGGIPIFTLKIESDGDYTFELKGPLDHGPDGNTESWLSIDFSNVVKASDHDSDYVVLGSNDFRIKIVDDVPVKGQQLQWTVDEDSSNYNNDGSNDDGLPGAIQGDGQGGANGDSNGGNPDYIGFANKPLGISFGADGPATNPYQFSTTFVARDQDGAPLALKSGGQDVTLVWAGNVLTGWAGGVEIFTLTIDQSNGTASFLLKGPLDHPDNNGSEYEDTISIEFAFTAEDKDGDKVNHSVKIFVNDDSPDACCMEEPLVISEPEGNGEQPVPSQVEISVTPSTYDDAAPGAITIDVGIYDQSKSWNGKGWSYADQFTEGGESSALFDNNDDNTGFGVTSDTDGGSGNRYDEVNYVDDGEGGDVKSEYISFKLTDVDQTATQVVLNMKWFFPDEQMESPGKGKGQDGIADEVGAYKLYKDGVAVSGWIEFTANNASGDFQLVVNPGFEFDEIRMIAKRGDGDDRNGNEAGDSSDYYVTGATFTVAGETPQDPEPNTVCGSICADFGADGPGSVVMQAGNPTGLTYGESEIVETVSQDGKTLQGMANGVLVYEVVLNVEENKFDFKLYRPIDGNDDHSLEFNYVVTDNDGDSDTGCIKITVEGGNDTPEITVSYPQTTAGFGVVDEDELAAGNKDNADGDDVGGASYTGNYDANFFGDNPGSVSFDVTEGDNSGIDTLEGANILWHMVSATEIVGYREGGNPANASDQYFKMTLSGPNPSDSGDGTWTFELLQAVKHGSSGTEDNLPLSVDIVATDEDGEVSAPATINIQIDDDMPVLEGQTGSFNLAVDETILGSDAGILNVDPWFPAGTAGADGGTTTFALTKADGQPITDGTATGLVDTLTGQAVFLYKNGANVEGRTAGGVVVFVISLNGAELKFDQQRSIEHGNTASHDEPKVFVSGVHVTKTITDKDGDSASLTASSAITATIYDDGPNANDDGNSVVTFGQAISGNVVANDSSGADVDTGFPNGKVESFSIGGNTYAADGVTAHIIPGHGTMKMFSNGDYEFTQTGGSAGSLEIEYKLLDGDGDSDTAKLTITTKDQPIEDVIVVGKNVDDTPGQGEDHQVDTSPNAPDGPIDGDVGNDVLIGDVGGKQTIIQPGKNYDIALVCDVSSSMVPGQPGNDGTNRLQLMKDALKNYVDSLASFNGVLNIALVAFGSNATIKLTISNQDPNWVANLKSSIDTLSISDGRDPGDSYNYTNYEAAFDKANEYFDTKTGTGNEKLTYFLTDGNPTTNTDDTRDGNTDFDDMEEGNDAFNRLLADHNTMKVHAIGIGTGVTVGNLQFFDNTNVTGQSTYDPSGNPGPGFTDDVGQPTIITNATQLAAALEGGSSTTVVDPLGNDLINGGAGADAILGDSIYYGSKDAGWSAYMADHAGQTTDQIRDDIYANLTTGNKSYAGEGSKDGNDTINGGAGNDVIFGQGGNDTIHGDADDDYIDGGSGNDTLFGDDGNDYLIGGAGIDTLNGGAGNDTLVYDSQDTFDGGTGFDTLKFTSPVNLNIDDDTGGNSSNFVNRVDNIEAIDLRNGSATDIFGGTSGDDTLSAADVIAMTDSDNILYILGEGNGGEGGAADDQVRLEGNWSQGSTFVANDPSNTLIHGIQFTAWTNGGATVYVQTTVDVDNNA